MYEFKADIAILMNITPDHLDRYDYKFENYVKSKFRILQNQTKDDYFIYMADDLVIRNEIPKHNIQSQIMPFSVKYIIENGAYAQNNEIKININSNNYITMSIFDLSLQGTHNTYNSMAASIAGSILELRKESIRESLKDFKGVEHRLEPVLKVHGMQFINDSKATNVNSTWFALETVPKNIIWIVGGVDKGNDYSELVNLVKLKVKAIVCLGEDVAKIHKAFEGIVKDIVDTKNIDEAVKTAYYLGSKGDNILLSPACASFDLFDNYEERGRKFKMAVRRL
jgi:UDP-N-acetylmuramoylalanine--D-glutamate ligase